MLPGIAFPTLVPMPTLSPLYSNATPSSLRAQRDPVESAAGGTRLPRVGQSRGLVEKPRPGLPPCPCLCPSMRCPWPPPFIPLGQFAICQPPSQSL